MSLSKEMGFPKGLSNPDHEALLSVLATADLVRKESGRLFGPLGITTPQFNVLILLLAQTDDGAMRQAELSRLLMVNRANVTGLVDRLEKLGFVERIADDGDRRANRVALTASGHAIAQKAQDLYLGRVHTIMKAVNPDAWRQLSESLSRIRAQVRQT